jgi:hypothetical protein
LPPAHEVAFWVKESYSFLLLLLLLLFFFWLMVPDLLSSCLLCNPFLHSSLSGIQTWCHPPPWAFPELGVRGAAPLTVCDVSVKSVYRSIIYLSAYHQSFYPLLAILVFELTLLLESGPSPFCFSYFELFLSQTNLRPWSNVCLPVARITGTHHCTSFSLYVYISYLLLYSETGLTMVPRLDVNFWDQVIFLP